MLGFSSYATQDPWAAYDAVQSPDECDDTLKRLINNFDTNRGIISLDESFINLSAARIILADAIEKQKLIQLARQQISSASMFTMLTNFIKSSRLIHHMECGIEWNTARLKDLFLQ